MENTPADSKNPPAPAVDRDEFSLTEPPVVLIVDDCANNLLALEALLRCDEFEIVTALSGREALDILLVRTVAVAIIDVQMPEMDGFELATLMRGVEKTRYVPIVFVTAGGRETSRMFKGYAVGAVDYLWKPIDEKVLRSKVDVFVTLERQRQQLLQAERMREMFVGILGHDLRNPLQSILIAAGRAATHAQDDELRKLLEVVRQSGGRMTRMIEQILDLTRIRVGGGLSISPTAVDFGDLLAQIVDEFVDDKSRFHIERFGNLRGRWDVDRILQLLSNLAGNALAHSPAGAPVHIRIDGRSDSLEFEMRNGGRSVPRALRNVLFEPFRSGDRSRGLGLGLFICKQIISAHGGSIRYESSDESGTCFQISLPRYAMAEETSVATEAMLTTTSLSGRTPTQSHDRRRLEDIEEDARRLGVILIVDDDPSVRHSLELLLSMDGHRVVAAPDGEGAADRVVRDRIRPDIVIVDYNLSQKETGVQVVARLREILNHDVPVIILTGAGSNGALRRLTLQNSVQLDKPADIDELTRAIEDFLVGSPRRSG
jgi:signal transduction histidine kinase